MAVTIAPARFSSALVRCYNGIKLYARPGPYGASMPADYAQFGRVLLLGPHPNPRAVVYLNQVPTP